MRDVAIVVGVVAVTLATTVATVAASRRLARPTRLLRRGAYGEAREDAVALARSWLGAFARVRTGARYVEACALHLRGEMGASLQVLEAIDRAGLATDVAYAVSSLEAANLVLLGREAARARDVLQGLVRAPEDDVLLALALHALGDATAESVFRSARGEELARSPLAEDKAPIFRCLRGLYLLATERPDEARDDFAAAAKSPHDSWYARRARSLAPREEADGARSSLAPQILDE